MSSIFSSLPLWRGNHCYVTAQADFLHQHIDPAHLNVGTTCLMTCSSSLVQRLLELVPPVYDGTLWPYRTTLLRVCQTVTGKRFAVHFPSFGGPRIANSLEQLAACGIRLVSGRSSVAATACTGPVSYVGAEAVQQDIANLKAPLQGTDSADVFLTAASPGIISFFLENRYYPSHEAYVLALADAMKQEYNAISQAGLLFQVDCPDLLLRSSLVLSFPHEKPMGRIYLLWLQALIQCFIPAIEERSTTGSLLIWEFCSY